MPSFPHIKNDTFYNIGVGATIGRPAGKYCVFAGTFGKFVK